jgi:hypothetical protein
VVAAYAYDWHSAQPPTLDELRRALGLQMSHHNYDGWLAHLSIISSFPMPPGLRWLGNLPVPDGVPALSNTMSGWQALADDVIRQRCWDQLPDAVKDAYRTGATRGPVEVDFGAGSVVIGAATPQLDLSSGRTATVSESGPVHWSALDLLPRCTTVTWLGPDRGLTAAPASRLVISSLTWHNAPAEVDLSKTRLHHLAISGNDLRMLRLPPGLRSLELTAPDPALRVDADSSGRRLRLRVHEAGPHTAIPPGLHGVRDVSLDGTGTFSATTLTALSSLQQLRLRWHSPPGELIDPRELAHLHQLAVVELVDGYGLEADTLPDLASLDYLGISGLRRSIIPALRSRYHATAVRLDLRGAKNDTWLAANLTNPFRDWVDDDARAGAAACRAYGAAVRALGKITLGQVDKTHQVRPILHDLITALNGVEEKNGVIDTVRREQAVDAFADLAAQSGVARETADQWFDEWRDF